MKTGRDKRDLVEAKDRAARSVRYAQMFPELIGPNDLCFQTEDWQLAQVKRFNAPCAPQK